ncbi:unnamed protein product [Camellia sinensis]
MDQFRQVGEVLGGIKALMVLKNDISINQRQCCLLLQIFELAFETISEEIKQNLKLEEKNTKKWKALEHPLRELQMIFKEGELYIRYCLDIKDWWGKAISLHQNKDCIEFHIHNLLCCFTVVIEAIETAGEVSGPDQDDMQKRRQMLMRKYDNEWNDPKIFQWQYGKQYLVPREVCNRLGSAWREDRWLLVEKMREKRSWTPATMLKHEQRLADLLIKKINGLDLLKGKFLPAWILLGARDYHVRRRLGLGGSHYKEIQWLGESFALRNFFGDVTEQLQNEMSFVQSLSHPNIMQYLCGFYDEERKEGFLVMELMNKCLGTYIKENCGQKKRLPFSLPVAVDIMLQIARGMEYLHSQQIWHGDLNPSNILLKVRNSSQEGYFYTKIRGFGLTSIKRTSRSHSNQSGEDPVIWYAPEVLAEQEQQSGKCSSKYTEKADVYSFGMLCFEILTGKIPFEEGHLQEDKMGRNIRAGERPLFPYTSPKYLVSLTRKCWQANPIQRLSFSAICRILRYIKKCLVINPDHGNPESPPPLVDYCEIEAEYSRLFPRDENIDLTPVSQIPFQMFSYRLVEKEKTFSSFKDRIWDWGDENGLVTEDPFLVPMDQRSVYSEVQERKSLARIGADQRSVCSETPRRRISSKTAADQRSLRSNFHLRKIDQMSAGSLTPDRKFLSTAADDQHSIDSDSPEWIKNLADDQRSECSEASQRKLTSSTPDQISGHLEAAERKIPSATTTDKKSVAYGTLERKIISSTITANQYSKMIHSRTMPKAVSDKTYSVIPEKKTLSRTVSDLGCYKIPKRKALPPIASESDYSSICSESPKNKILSKKSSDQRPRSEVPERKVLAKKKVAVAKTNQSPGQGAKNSLSKIITNEDNKRTFPKVITNEDTKMFNKIISTESIVCLLFKDEPREPGTTRPTGLGPRDTAQTPTGGNPRKHKEHSEYPYLLKHLAISTIGKQANLIILAEVIDPFQVCMNSK